MVTEFQSLIGILQTTVRNRVGMAISKFQSLIGILQTEVQGKNVMKEMEVSIPYRYSTN